MGAAFSVEVEGEERLVVVQELNQRAIDSAEVLEGIIEAVAKSTMCRSTLWCSLRREACRRLQAADSTSRLPQRIPQREFASRGRVA